MRFYYMSIISLAAVIIYYFVVLWIVRGYWSVSRKDLFANTVALTIAAAVLVAPWAEELWIAYNFGQLCRKDAGIFINKVVEVEGYYDATANRLSIDRQVLPVTAESFEKQGYKFYEQSLRYEQNGLGKVAHFKKLNGEWVGSILDKPKARYHYTRNIYGEEVAHKITRVEARVTDSENGTVIGRYVSYGRGPYWFYVSLGRPPYSCDGPDGGPNSKHNSLIYREVLKPVGK